MSKVSFRNTQSKTLFHLLSTILAALLLQLLFPVHQVNAAQPQSSGACNLTIEIVAAPFAVVDSNAPGAAGPQVGMLAARILNTGSQSIDNLRLHIGNGTTPGTFTATGGKALRLLTGSDATRLIPSLPAGGSIASYWAIAYPATYDVSYPYTVWAETTGGCITSQSAQLTTQSEISASANKLLPSGSFLQISPNSVAPGGQISVQITGFTLGTIGQGPKPLAPYDAWLQPVGNLDFDPTCLRLVRSEVKLNSISATPFADRLYFSGLKSYSANTADSVTYTFLALKACSTTIQPYQEAASGTQEKYNSDYSNAGSRISITSSGASPLQLSLTPDTPTASAGQNVQLTASARSGGQAVGYPGGGSPVVITAAIPAETRYTAGSASAQVPAQIQYSSNNGQSWNPNQPTDPTTVTHLRWILAGAVDSSPDQVSFSVTLDANYSGAPIRARADGGLLDAGALTSAEAVINDSNPTPTPTPSPTPTPEPPTVQSGSEGGLESGPLEGEPSDFLGGIGGNQRAGDKSAASAHKARLLARMNLQLDDLMPQSGPAGTTPRPAVPVDVLAITAAPDAQAVDFVDGAGKVQAVALGILSVGGPYEHDYGVCNRFKEYEFSTIEPVEIDGNWYWHTASAKGQSIREEALIFHIFVDESSRQFHIDNRWVQDDYPDSFAFDFDYVFNMQVWSSSQPHSQALLQAIVDRLRGLENGAWQVIYHNDQQPARPQLFITDSQFQADSVHIGLFNSSESAGPVRIYGSWRSYLDRNHSVPFEYNLTIPAGRTGLTFSFPGLLDVTLYTESDGFTDKIYTGGGLWFNFKNAPAAQVEMTPGQCRALETIDSTDLLLAGCIDLQSSSVLTPASVGLGRTLNPNGRPVDVSPYAALRFWAKGDGTPVRVLLETGSVADSDYHQTVLTPDREWRQYILPLADFAQQGYGAPVPFTGKDVIAVVWMNAGNADGTFQLSVDSVSFTNGGRVSLRQQPTDSADTGPRTVAVDGASEARANSSTIFYSLDRGRTFASAGMSADSQGFSGQIPGQDLGSDVLYFVEMTGANGYVSRLPFDAPASLLRYRVDDRPSLLVDDFAGARLRNRLNGGAGLFQNESAGGGLQVYRGGRQLRLDYAVAGAEQFAGYFSEVGVLDISAYATLDLRVKGATGGEQLLVGLRDGSGNEPKVSVGALLPGGVESEWRWVQIPLSAFAPALNRQDVRSLSLSFAKGSGPGSGTIFVDEIRLTALPSPLVIGLFDDGNPATNGQGGGSWILAPGGALTVQAEAVDAYAPGHTPAGFALRMDYQVTSGYALWHTDLHGGPTAGFLTLWVKSTGALLPNLYLTDGATRGRALLSDYAANSAAWQFVSIPLSVFQAQGVDTARLSGFEVAFEFGNGLGTFWLDSVGIGQPGELAAGQRTVHMRDLDAAALALHNSGGQQWTAQSDAPWLGVSALGYGPANLLLWTSPWELAPGDYTGQVVLGDGAGGQETLTVHLHVTETATPPAHIYLPVVGR